MDYFGNFGSCPCDEGVAEIYGEYVLRRRKEDVLFDCVVCIA